MSSKRKLVELSIEKKKEIIDLIEKGVSQRKLAERFGVSKTTICNALKNKNNIMQMWMENCSSERRRKSRKTDHDEINSAVLEFFKKCRSKNIPISGPMLQTKAKDIARELGFNDFQASNGWLEAFRLRNNINFRILSGESASADSNAANDWKSKVSNILKEYPVENQFNADETGLFFRQLPTKSLVSKNEKCFGGKLPKERLTILFCCSATGEKLKPLVIGNAAYPRAFRQNKVKTENLPVIWKNNRKAWMNLQIFEEWLKSVNAQMKFQNRKIILFIDNVSSHKINSLSNVHIEHLPPNLISLVQSPVLSVICAMKKHYRKLLLNCLITKVETCEDVTVFVKSVTVYDAIRWINDAWKGVSSSTIQKCFHAAGFPTIQENQELNEESQNLDLKMMMSVLPSEFQKELDLQNEKFASFDDDLIVHEDVAETAEEIYSHVLSNLKGPTEDQNQVSEESDDEVSVENCLEKPPLTHQEALNYVNYLIQYAMLKQPEITEKLMDIHVNIEKHWAETKCKGKQTKINDYFAVKNT